MGFRGFLDLQCGRVKSQPAPVVGHGAGILEHLAETITTRNGPEERQSHPGKYPQPDEEPGERGGVYGVGMREWHQAVPQIQNQGDGDV